MIDDNSRIATFEVDYLFISSDTELKEFADRSMESSVLAIDTEFMREKTYYPKLCLLQMATDSEVVVVDPFAVSSLEVLRGPFESPSVTKLFHAGGQDIEILYREVGCMPLPLFDTQIAAALLGFTMQVGYGALVQSVCGVALKKGDSFTDWSRRPLSRSQLSYAADDVIYLPKLYEDMVSRLKKAGREHWLDDEFAELADPTRYEISPRERYRKLKRVNQLSARQLSAAREVSEWREEVAMRRDIPRKWVLGDEQIVEACRKGAENLDQLFMIRGVREKLSTSDARKVVGAIVRGMSLPKEEWPRIENPGRNEAHVDAEVEALGTIVKLRARESDIAYQALASQSDLASVARGYRDSAVLKGWRLGVVGKDLVAFMEGELAISAEGGKVKVTKRK